MARSGISDAWLRGKNGKKDGRDITKTDGDALEVRVRNGTISFIFRPLIKGENKRVKITLGRYPAMSLSDARKKLAEQKAIVEKGLDPRKVKKAEILKATTEPTLNEIYDHWYKHWCSEKLASHKQYKKSYDTHIRPGVGAVYYKDITRRALIDVLAEVAQKAQSIASRLVTNLTQAIDLAYQHGLTDKENVLVGFKRATIGIKRGKGTRVLNRQELHAIFEAIKTGQFHPRNILLFRLLIFYGCRGGELRLTEKSWVDFDRMQWTVPAEAHKTGNKTDKPIVRPILPEMKHLWEQAFDMSSKGKYLFNKLASKVELGSEPITSSAFLSISNAIEINMGKKRQTDPDTIDIPHWSTHDLRRTARTFWSDMPSATWEVCERMLGHTLPGVTDTYDLSDSSKRMIPIYKEWWDELQDIEKNPTKVITLAKNKDSA